MPESVPEGEQVARDPRPHRGSFGSVALAGVGTAALAALAGSRPWIGAGSTGGSADASMAAVDQGTRYPAASAVSLLLLAAWGVLLVTRGRVRRAFAVVAALAAVGLVATVVTGYQTLPDQVRVGFEELMGRGGQDNGFTGWFWTAAVAAVLAVPPALLAVRLVPQWPEMGSRYDAPASRDGQPTTEIRTERDLWTALDEGRDPTTGDEPRRGASDPDRSV
ncbi:MAG TPA: Trp biosynthesis-associated membrane protein [Marmoricola sp.]|nr:Trp biosynthesis-associated membrane protein [Marmoricola sp.]